jgi:hypothetical protein
MAQGNSKGLASAAGSGGRQSKHAQNPKKGARSIPPKKLGAVVRRTMQKNLSSKINNSIEKQMVTAASGGKLTIMKNKGDTPAYVHIESTERASSPRKPKS